MLLTVMDLWDYSQYLFSFSFLNCLLWKLMFFTKICYLIYLYVCVLKDKLLHM